MTKTPSKGLLAILRLANSIHVTLYRTSHGKFAGEIAKMPLLLITTYGRKTGKPHTNPVVYIRDGKDYLVSASAGGMPWNPSWYFNLEKKPDIKIEIGDQHIEVHAEIAHGEERNHLYEKFKAASPNFVKYEKGTSRVIQVIRLIPR